VAVPRSAVLPDQRWCVREKNQRVTARPTPSAHASLTRVGGSDLRPRDVSWRATGEGEADEHAVGNSVVGELGGFAAGRACRTGRRDPFWPLPAHVADLPPHSALREPGRAVWRRVDPRELPV
jgi:hypothetical protein